MTKPKDDAKQESLKKKLTPLQYEVTQEEGTEPPFNNEYWDNKAEGIYVDVVSGEPLFSSQDKYDSGTGWPSFSKPLEPHNITEKEDRTLLNIRTEVRSKSGNSHLGHVFDDGPKPTGKRYCMNSAALKFIPKEKLVQEGYGQYVSLFDKNASKKPSQDEVAYFAGGCFWCAESDFLTIRGVKAVLSGYTGGDEINPTYEQVSTGKTGHAESIRVTFDPQQISYDDLLKVFWLNIDPTVKDRQFCDVGHQYRTAIFYKNEEQKKAALNSLTWLKKEFPNIKPVTEIVKAKEFYAAEGYHQNYAQNNPIRYKSYRYGCARDPQLETLYGDKREKILRAFEKK